jgi:tagatose-1,6-bisphosphate aldolase
MTRRRLTPGKVRGLTATSSPEGIFRVLAIDHRDSLRVEIYPDEPEAVSEKTMTAVKLDLLRRLGGDATAVMLDPEYSIAQAIMARALPGSVGFLAAVEAQGYLGDPTVRQTSLLDGWSVAKAKRVGASAIKFLVLYRPEAGSVTEAQDELIGQVVVECARYDIPLFLEPLPYRVAGQAGIDSPEFAETRRRVVVETVRRLGKLGADVLKVPFPVDTRFETDRRVWADACAELDEASPVPWVLLSGGDPYELFRDQVQIACAAGASGFLVGRALWRDFVAAPPEQRDGVVEETIRPRLAELSQLAVEYGRNWAEWFTIEDVDERWYLDYREFPDLPPGTFQ